MPVPRGRLWIIELAITPAMAFRVSVGEGEIGDLAVVVGRKMVDRSIVHVDAKHGAADAVREDFAEHEDQGRGAVYGGFGDDFVSDGIWDAAVLGGVPAHITVHSVAPWAREEPVVHFPGLL